MFPIVRTVARRALMPKTSFIPVRTHVIAAPPLEKVSLAEKLILGLIMVSCICATPMYIMSHLNDYKKRD